MCNCNNACTPLLRVVSVAVNGSTNIATCTLNAAPPAAGPFDVCFCNLSGSCQNPSCITPCQYPAAQVQFKFGTTTYSQVFSGRTGDFIKLSQLVKFAQKYRKMHFNSAYGTSGALVCCDKLPCANASITVTSPSVVEDAVVPEPAVAAAKK